MSKPTDRMVYQRPDNLWANKANGADKPRSLHRTQAEAVAAARDILANNGGGELITKGRDQQIRSKDTIPPGNDPRNIRDTER